MTLAGRGEAPTAEFHGVGVARANNICYNSGKCAFSVMTRLDNNDKT